MEEERQALQGDGGGGGCGGVSSIRNSVTTTLSLPLTRLNSGEHRIFIEDCLAPQLDGYDDLSFGDCGYSKLFVLLDVLWNLAFVLVSVSVLLSTIPEKPSTPLRVWIGGFALQCLVHVGFVYVDYQRRNQADLGIEDDDLPLSESHLSVIKKLGSMNRVISSIWWVFGFYWIVVGGQALLRDSPHLYWLAVIFLAFEAFFMIFCILMACIVFFVLFCCFPILATIAYAMAIGEGASENDIRTLPKYKYYEAKPLRTFDNKEGQNVGLRVDSGNSTSSPELVLHPEDSECCICLYQYRDGAELCSLPCNHHFHHGCISKWLRINATCPLCKFNILRGDALV